MDYLGKDMRRIRKDEKDSKEEETEKEIKSKQIDCLHLSYYCGFVIIINLAFIITKLLTKEILLC